MKEKKKNVLFIGSFKTSGKDGTVGGQMFACNSLVNSDLKESVNWILLDTTAHTNLDRSFYSRIIGASFRIIKSIYFILFKDIDIVMAFCSSGYSFLEKGSILKLAKLLNKKTIIASRSGHLINDIRSNIKFKNRVQSIFNSCDKIICQGTYWKTFFITQFNIPEDKLVIIHNWIDIDTYNCRKSVIGRPVKILFLGWIDENKGIWNLLEAIKQLQHENFIVSIAGNGKEYKKLSSAIQTEKLESKIHLLSWIYGDEKVKILNEADIFILPSFREGLPNALLEAMASNTAVIASDVGAISDIIRSGENGYLIKAGDTSSLVELIKCYLNDENLIRLHSEKALKTVKQQNSLPVVVPKFLNLFDISEVTN